MVRLGLVLTLSLVVALIGLGRTAVGQGPAEDDAQPPSVRVATPAKTGAKPATRKSSKGSSAVSVTALIKQGNPILWPLGLCSIVTVGCILERMLALRRRRVIPRDFVERFQDRLSAGKLDRDRAIELCRANESTAARIFAHAVKYWGQPSATIRQGLALAAGVELSDLRRNIRVLNGTATLAPLLGLLGTVIGMIESFDAIGGTSSGKGEALAHGISVALLSTALGLAIAVVAVAAYYYLLGRVDALVRDLDEQAGRVVDLISAESGRPLADRRFAPGPADYARHEPRAI
jgi:biopolymer transport protein ExbB